MSEPITPVPTEAQQILAGIDDLMKRLDMHAGAINALGTNVQWLVDNVKGIFEMIHNPMFAAMLGGMTGGMTDGGNQAPGE